MLAKSTLVKEFQKQVNDFLDITDLETSKRGLAVVFQWRVNKMKIALRYKAVATRTKEKLIAKYGEVWWLMVNDPLIAIYDKASRKAKDFYYLAAKPNQSVEKILGLR